MNLRDSIEKVESEEESKEPKSEEGYSSDNISLCDSDCSGCEERLRKHKAKELY